MIIIIVINNNNNIHLHHPHWLHLFDVHVQLNPCVGLGSLNQGGSTSTAWAQVCVGGMGWSKNHHRKYWGYHLQQMLVLVMFKILPWDIYETLFLFGGIM